MARDVVFVVDGAAAAEAASTGAASAMLAAASGKTGLEDLEGLGESGRVGESEFYEESDFVKENRVPLDRETVLNRPEYSRTNFEERGAKIYKKGAYYYHRDTMHKGKGAHLEVYDLRGAHVGEADVFTGTIKSGTQDVTKHIMVN